VKKVLAWVKAHLLVVISCVVIVVSIPAGLVGSSILKKGIYSKREKEASEALRAVENTTVTYSVPALTPGGRPIEMRGVPTSEKTKWFAERRERVEREAKEAYGAVVAFNQRRHKAMVDGLFPSAGSRANEVLKCLELGELLFGRGASEGYYAKLLRDMRAGGPMDPARVSTALDDLRQRELEQMQVASEQSLPPEKLTQLRKALSDRRIAMYRQRAQELGVYASMDVLPISTDDYAMIRPKIIGSEQPTIVQAFEWQWTAWMVTDLFDAIREANTSTSGEPLDVERAPVKRILRVALMPMGSGGAARSEGDEEGGGDDSGGSAGGGKGVSITGRVPGRNNGSYDVRIVPELSLIVDSAEIPRVLEAFERTNFIAVIGMQVTEVDPWADLREGYYYGSAHVVRLDLRLETVWLRSWTAKLMPAQVRRMLGVPDPRPESGGDQDASDGGGD
jgi:hypothetical protein